MYDKRYEIYTRNASGYELRGSTDDLPEAVESARRISGGVVFDTRRQEYPYGIDRHGQEWGHSAGWER